MQRQGKGTCFKCKSLTASPGNLCFPFFVFIGYQTKDHLEHRTEKLRIPTKVAPWILH